MNSSIRRGSLFHIYSQRPGGRGNSAAGKDSEEGRKMESEVALAPTSADTTEGPLLGVGEIAIETVFFATSNTGRNERRLHVVVLGGWTTAGAQRARVQKTVQWARNKKDTPGGSGHLESTRNARGCTRRRDLMVSTTRHNY
jgi:hypothetical protein